MTYLYRFLDIFRVPKVRVALVTIIVACAAEFGIDLDERITGIIVGVGLGLILHRSPGEQRHARPEVRSTRPPT